MPSVKVLVVEDEILIARRIETTLQQLGYSVVAIAMDGESAIQKVAETCPDLVLMDVLMPGEIDGIEAAKQIQVRFQTPVVYLTAFGDSDTLSRAKVSQPFGYILKPFQPQDLDTAIQVALVRQSVEQQKLDTLRKTISTSLPHEVNTPLNSILGFVNLLVKRYDFFSKAEVLEMLMCIRSSAIRLDRLYQNFLFYTRLEAIATSPTQFNQLKQDTALHTQDLINLCAARKAKEFDRTEDLQLELQPIAAQISEANLQKIIEELLDNAFKFSEAGTAVQVKTSLQNQLFTLSVSDRGRGLTSEQIASLGAYVQFERSFYEQQGLGLGLALVKRLTELYDGGFAIESTVQQGTTVIVQLTQPSIELQQL